jgi:transcriptional regulator with XRE-family HTH domain
MVIMLRLFSGLGPALRRLREQGAGLTQVQVAERTGISQGRLSRYETGRKIPDLSTLERLLLCYGTDLVGLDRALQEVRGTVPAADADPEFTARVRAALANLGYTQPSREP